MKKRNSKKWFIIGMALTLVMGASSVALAASSYSYVSMPAAGIHTTLVGGGKYVGGKCKHTLTMFANPSGVNKTSDRMSTWVDGDWGGWLNISETKQICVNDGQVGLEYYGKYVVHGFTGELRARGACSWFSVPGHKTSGTVIW